jgi:hypothetical protein
MRQGANVTRRFVPVGKGHKSALLQVFHTGLDRLTHLFILDGVQLPAFFHHPQTFQHYIAGVAKLAGLDKIDNEGFLLLTQFNVMRGHCSSLPEQRSGIVRPRKD